MAHSRSKKKKWVRKDRERECIGTRSHTLYDTTKCNLFSHINEARSHTYSKYFGYEENGKVKKKN